jgi:hypothetical protein
LNVIPMLPNTLQQPAAVRALGQRVVGERLHDLEVFAALLAAVLVRGHS